MQNTLVASALLRWGTPEQKQNYLSRLATDTVGAYALSEAGSGSDAFALQTRAEKRGGEYLLTGRKLWITNAKEAGLFIVFATVDASAGYKGITAFLVEKGAAGFTVGRKEDKLGIRASSTCELILDECAVPAAQVLGEAGNGYKIAMETLNGGRIGIGAQMLGLAEGAWSHAVKHAKERKQFGKALVEFQAMQFQLAEMATEIEAARLMVYNAARLKDAQLEFRKEAAMCKYFASHTAERVASLAVEVLGGLGLCQGFPRRKALPRRENRQPSTRERRSCNLRPSRSWCCSFLACAWLPSLEMRRPNRAVISNEGTVESQLERGICRTAGRSIDGSVRSRGRVSRGFHGAGAL